LRCRLSGDSRGQQSPAGDRHRRVFLRQRELHGEARGPWVVEKILKNTGLWGTRNHDPPPQPACHIPGRFTMMPVRSCLPATIGSSRPKGLWWRREGCCVQIQAKDRWIWGSSVPSPPLWITHVSLMMGLARLTRKVVHNIWCQLLPSHTARLLSWLLLRKATSYPSYPSMAGSGRGGVGEGGTRRVAGKRWAGAIVSLGRRPRPGEGQLQGYGYWDHQGGGVFSGRSQSLRCRGHERELVRVDQQPVGRGCHGRENLGASSGVLRVMRGGAFDDFARRVACACRFRHLPVYRCSYFGFRVVASPLPLDSEHSGL